ncbi:HpcH/HpaI aldolase/citrate lyase family protein [Lampropedia aestuarii]|uniref:HpcH/HpaI aldolase/citrate lyase family protein n=1 Tax=Lampropedia aestuarii TaxID=2562762 RepID=UPI002468AF78|nr:aldolase/citrate lyase family protein [Lampropedia aestuarii]MDH5856217.1 aldolase/citrate lyase family protein [Lampropedia aestuarii]
MSLPVDHPRAVLLGSQAGAFVLPVCDHYSGVEARMRKSLQLQAEMAQEFGACVFDVTLDCEDGAAVGAEHEHAHLVAELAAGAAVDMRVAARLHAVNHAAFADDVQTIVSKAGSRLSHLMIPKVESVQDIVRAAALVDAAGAPDLPLHALIESPLAVHRACEIAAHPRVQSLSFGLMDFVSAHGGAIGAEAMGVVGQFSHPVVVQAKLAIAAACHAYGKTPSHCVVTEFQNLEALGASARQASRQLSYTRMWSIHPSQIRPILDAFSPEPTEVALSVRIIEAAFAAQWAPISHAGVLHDRASYRYFWQVLERAYRVGCDLPEFVKVWLAPPRG